MTYDERQALIFVLQHVKAFVPQSVNTTREFDLHLTNLLKSQPPRTT